MLNGRRNLASRAEPRVTVDFHLTWNCAHACPYCWGPKDSGAPVDTATALRIVCRVSELGAGRILFTGGDPLTRPDTRLLILYARDLGLEVALATAGERLSREFLSCAGRSLNRVLLPLDGSCEAVNCRTKRRWHFTAVLQALARLRDYPAIDLTIRTAVTRHNIEDVPRISRLVEEYAGTTSARVRHEVYKAFRRNTLLARWRDLVVRDEEFTALHGRVRAGGAVPVEFVDHGTLERARMVIFPDGRLVIPQSHRHHTYDRLLEISDLEACLKVSRISADQDGRQFDS